MTAAAAIAPVALPPPDFCELAAGEIVGVGAVVCTAPGRVAPGVDAA
jgi:hypothetical protein